MKLKIFMGIFSALLITSLSACKTEVQTVVKVAADSPMTDEELGAHILRTMDHVKSPLSPMRRQLLAQLLVGIANNTFDRPSEKRDWIRVLAIESKFDNTAKSPVGAVGLGQVMPQYVKDFGKFCGLKDLREGDAQDLLVNATLSACVWRRILENTPDRSVVLALSSYNAGPTSTSTKNIQRFGSPVEETAKYITRFTFLKEVTEKPSK